MVLSMLYKGAVVVALGAPVAGVLAFEALLNATSMFNHGNVRLPARLDRALRTVLVTPDMHRVHHSALRTRPTATSASASRGGIGCSGPTGPSPARGTRR
jgi:sterol desaturase/sphingolipid hydroxylase (fatty acid hydroxylase superfamily)